MFNKKAKEVMNREIKNSELKKRAPWQFIKKIIKEENKELNIYSATWKSIWFGDKNIRICTDKESRFSKPFRWIFSEDKFNLLYDYFSGRRLEELKIEVIEDEIINIEGLDDLEEVIWKILIQREFEESGTVKIRNVGENRIPVNMILRNQCIQLLNKLMDNEFAATMVLEKSFSINRVSDSVDVSLLYSIPLNSKNEIAIIWESLELEKSKGTHIFRCPIDEYENTLTEIKFQIQNIPKIRSTLNKIAHDNMELQKKLGYITRINHNNFNYSTWENSLLVILPELIK